MNLNYHLSQWLEDHAEGIWQVIVPLGLVLVVLFLAWLSIRVGN